MNMPQDDLPPSPTPPTTPESLPEPPALNTPHTSAQLKVLPKGKKGVPNSQATQYQPTNGKPRIKKPGSMGVYTQAVLLQRLILKEAQKDKTTGSALSQLARAWSELEERKRILKMKPKPKDVDVSKQQRGSDAQPTIAIAIDAPADAEGSAV